MPNAAAAGAASSNRISQRGTMKESLTQRYELETSQDGEGKCTLVSYPREYEPERTKIITNPALVAELSLFLVLLMLGFIFMYATNGETPRTFDYGVIFFSAGVVPFMLSVIAPFVRNPNVSFFQAVQIKDVLVYLMIVGAGVVMVVVDDQGFQNSDNGDGSWRLLLGYTMLEAGLIYFAVRSFLLTEAPEDRARRLEEEVLYLRESISKGVSESYFLNFVRWVAKDMVKSRAANHGKIQFQPSLGSALASTTMKEQDIRAMVVVVPILNNLFSDDDGGGEAAIDDRMFVHLQDLVEQRLGDGAVRGSIVPPINPNNKGKFSRGQTILQARVEKVAGPLSGQQEAFVFLDIPTTLLTICKNVAGNNQFRTAKEKNAAFARDMRRFSSQLVWNLQRSPEELPDPDSLVVVFEYEGNVDAFAPTLEQSLVRHFLISSGESAAASTRQEGEEDDDDNDGSREGFGNDEEIPIDDEDILQAANQTERV